MEIWMFLFMRGTNGENIQANLNNNNNNESFNEWNWIVDNSDWKTYSGGDGVTVETDAYQRIQQAGCVHAGIKATLEYVSTQLKYLRPNGKLTLSFRSKYFQWYWGLNCFLTVSRGINVKFVSRWTIAITRRDYGGGGVRILWKDYSSTFVDARSSFEKKFCHYVKSF